MAWTVFGGISFLHQLCGKIGSCYLHVDHFFLFFKTPRDESIKPHFVSSTPFLGVFVRAARMLGIELLLRACKGGVALAKIVERGDTLNCQNWSHIFLSRDELGNPFLNKGG